MVRAMRIVSIILAILLVPTLAAADVARDLGLAREMLEDAAIRDDEEGLRLVRERLLRIAAEAADDRTLRDAHHLIALSAHFELYTGRRDLSTATRLVETGIRHADRAVRLDERFADGWMLSAMLRGSARNVGLTVPPDPAGSPSRFARATELDPNSPGVALFSGLLQSFDPAGPARPQGVKLLEQLVARLDADRAATGRRFGLWDANAHMFLVMVRRASNDPRSESLRADTTRLLAQRPDHAQTRQIAETLTDRRFADANAFANVTWEPALTDPANDGKDPKLPDVIAVERGATADRHWYRVTFREPLPRAFGVNLAFDRDGDPSTGMRWWGTGSTFRFDRLVTAWIARDGDRYFGAAGVTSDDAARFFRLANISTDIAITMTNDDRSVVLGIPRTALSLMDTSTMIAAGGSHLVWNDDATSASNSR
ncbi:MAG TPA: hypothetical protein VEK79_20900 [Thermoanaerobaculia bacterium]|nr:hypothetical protein [Thermoanaerobaculia bacterium]